MKNFLPAFIFVLFIFFIDKVHAQVPQSDTARAIELIKVPRYSLRTIDSVTRLTIVAGGVTLKDGTTLFYADSAVINLRTNIAEAYGNVHINDADTLHTYSQFMRYDGKTKKAHLEKNVRLTDGKGTLTTPELDYDMATRIGIYTRGGKIVSDKTTITSMEGEYFGDTKDVYFRHKVVLKSPDNDIRADSLLYNLTTEVAKFIAKTTIITNGTKVNTTDGYYDKRTGKSYFGSRSDIDDKDFTLVADNIALDKITGFGEASGNVVFRTKNSINKQTLLAGNAKFNRNTNAVLATQKPVMILAQDGDSLYVTADTLYSAKLSELRKYRSVPFIRDSGYKINTADTSTNRFFEAYYNVRVFNDSLQSVSDSMFYSFEDSVFRLFKDPVIWAQGRQIVGDTIYLFTKNKKAERAYVFENAVAIDRTKDDFYNQVKGNTINAYFVNGEMDYVRARVNAESIYYPTDEADKYIGVNRTEADVIDMFFTNRHPQKVKFISNVKGTTIPMRQANHTEMRVRGFRWMEARRPKTKFELLGN